MCIHVAVRTPGNNHFAIYVRTGSCYANRMIQYIRAYDNSRTQDKIHSKLTISGQMLMYFFHLLINFFLKIRKCPNTFQWLSYVSPAHVRYMYVATEYCIHSDLEDQC